jgi:hypothetical protein
MKIDQVPDTDILVARKVLQAIKNANGNILLQGIRRMRGGAITHLVYNMRLGKSIVNLTELDNNAALVFLETGKTHNDDDAVLSTSCTCLLESLDDTFGTIEDVEPRMMRLSRLNAINEVVTKFTD